MEHDHNTQNQQVVRRNSSKMSENIHMRDSMKKSKYMEITSDSGLRPSIETDPKIYERKIKKL